MGARVAAVAAPVLRGRPPRTDAAALGLAGLLLASAALRTGVLHDGYWADEGISVGVAAHPLAEIPDKLRQDGSPPLYYLLLHAWMRLFGNGEAATRSLSLAFALAAVPLAAWAGRRLFGVRAGWLAAAGFALVPFLTRYAQETRMYALVVDESLVVVSAFVLAAVRGERRHLLTLGAAAVLLLYTHAWAVFLVGAVAIAWVVLWRAGRASGRDGLLVGAATLAAFAPWIPTLAFQAGHTAAPWSPRPSAAALLETPVVLLGGAGAALVAAACVTARRRAGGLPSPAGLLLALATGTVTLAWAASQVQPAWAGRYLAVALAPLLLAVAGIAARGGRVTALALAGVAVAWCATGPPAVRSNVRTVATKLDSRLVPGDVVMAAAPQAVPVLAHYLVAGVRFVTPSGPVRDPGVTDWRDLVERLERARTRAVVRRTVARLRPGAHLVLVEPLPRRGFCCAPLRRVVGKRTTQLRVALARDDRLRLVAWTPAVRAPDVRSQVRATTYVRVRRGR